MFNKVSPVKTPDARSSSPAELNAAFKEYFAWPLFKKSRYSTSVLIRGVWSHVVASEGAEQTKERLKSLWTTLGVVSALLLSVTYQSCTNPLTSDDPSYGVAVSFANVSSAASMMMSIYVILKAVVFTVEIDLCTTEEDLRDFINAHGKYFDLMTGVFSASVVVLVASALACIYVNYILRDFLIVMGLIAAEAVGMVSVALVITVFTRFRLWVRCDSPEALKTKEKQQQQEI